MAQAAKAAMFVWEGTDKSGKRVKGEMSGQSDALVKANLRRQGVNPLKVKKKPKSLFSKAGKSKITPKDITVFSRQLATMMSSGVPLVQAFEITGRGHENAGMQELILGIKADVEAGNNLTEALRKNPRYFNDLYCNLMIFVIPQFSALFENFGAALPALTQFLVDSSNFFVANWWWMFGAMGGAVYGAMELKQRSIAVQHFLDRAILKVP